MVFPVRFSKHLWQASVVGLRKANSGSRATLADEAYYAIRDLILRGKLPLGAIVSRRQLATKLGMSMLPVAEAA